MLALLSTFSWQELRQHPWRNLAAVLAVTLGVALAFSVQLINGSALSEFASAVRSVGGQPDLTLRAVQGGFDESVYQRAAAHPQVTLASPVLEATSYAVLPDGSRRALRLVGIDALVVAALAPGLMPVPADSTRRMALFEPDTVFLNPSAHALLTGPVVQLQVGLRLKTVSIAGSVSAAGAPLAVMDIGAAQDLLGRQGQLSRVDLRLAPGSDAATVVAALDLPRNVAAAAPDEAAQRVSNLSRAYRVNLTVLALVALFTGGFLVFSVLSLSVAKRGQQFALLGVLGLTARQRLSLVLTESVLLGLIGSVLGIALGTALAALALRLLGGDLGGGYFSGVTPPLQWSSAAALVYGALGVLAAAIGGFWPARAVRNLPLAQTLKGLGAGGVPPRQARLSVGLMLAGGLLALAPPVMGIALAAYLSVGLLLVGGITALPWLIALLYDRLSPWVARRLLPMLAVERARRVRQAAAVAVSGVVASLSLAVALTVMVASFRDSMIDWLDVLLPAQLYVRTGGASAAADTVFFPAGFAQTVAQIDGVQRVGAQRVTSIALAPGQPAVALLAKRMNDASRELPLIGPLATVPPGQVPIYVSEAMVDLYGARTGQTFKAMHNVLTASGDGPDFFVAGVWRDYARQNGSIAMNQQDFARLTGDERINDLALYLREGTNPLAVQQAVRNAASAQGGGEGLVDFASAADIRAISLKIFDRSFAVTYWLQAVAIAIGLFGIAASFSAQVLARRREFGLLAHLGLTRRQILTVVAGEGAAWTVIGSVAGLLLGLAVSVVLVKVVNPQSFHWTMDLQLPWLRLALLCAAVVIAGTVTAWLAGRAAAARQAVLSVKEDW